MTRKLNASATNFAGKESKKLLQQDYRCIDVIYIMIMVSPGRNDLLRAVQRLLEQFKNRKQLNRCSDFAAEKTLRTTLHCFLNRARSEGKGDLRMTNFRRSKTYN